MSRTYHPSNAIRGLHRSAFPYVMVSYTEGDDVPFVGLDLDRAGYIVGQHLVAGGRRRFGFVGDKFGSRMFEIRGGGFVRAVEESGFIVDPAFTFEYPNDGEWNDYRSGYEVGQHVATLASKPDAMFFHNDLGALGFEDAMLEAGIRVPDDIAIVGIDDIELASRARVPLTTVRQPSDLIGAFAVDTLLARLRGEQPPVRQLLTPELIVRRSSGAGDDDAPPIARSRPRALRSLKEHAAAPRGL